MCDLEPSEAGVGKIKKPAAPGALQSEGSICGAGDETRTRDNLLGRQGLYQLSYSRICYVKQFFRLATLHNRVRRLKPRRHYPKLRKKREEPLASFFECSKPSALMSTAFSDTRLVERDAGWRLFTEPGLLMDGGDGNSQNCPQSIQLRLLEYQGTG